MNKSLFPIIFAILIVVNVTVFLLFGYDKRQARKNGWRVSEQTLLISALFGPFGAIAGMKAFRHKIQKAIFFILVLLCAAIQVAVFIVIAGG
jgi:uncharacterized membrane protein YsdA (DUF1294 family)